MFLPRVLLVLAICAYGAAASPRSATKRTLKKVLRQEIVASPAVAQDNSEWDQVRAAYGLLTHVAGTGFDQDVNSWSPDFEGGEALAAELSNPHMAAADAAGNIYIADKESHSILKVTPAGTIHTVAGTHVEGFNGDGPATLTQLDSPNGLFVLADGTFYILDLLNLRICRVGTNGQLTTVLQQPSLLAGRALWVAPDEQLIYFPGLDGDAIPSLKRWTPARGIEVVASGFSSLGNITVDRERRPIVTEDTGNRVFRIEANGDKTLIAGNGSTSDGGDGALAIETGLNRVRGVASLPNGGFFLATQKGANIWYVDTAGIIHKMLDCAPSGIVNEGNNEPFDTPGIKMSEPRAVTIAPNGDLIITASDYGQVRVIKCVQPPLPPMRVTFEGTFPDALRLRWNGIPWQSYFVESTSTLQSTNWQVLGVRTSEPDVETLYALPPTNGASDGFYRVRAPR